MTETIIAIFLITVVALCLWFYKSPLVKVYDPEKKTAYLYTRIWQDNILIYEGRNDVPLPDTRWDKFTRKETGFYDDNGVFINY